MSDVPELDRLIEESENFRRNAKWRKSDRRFKVTILLMFLFFNVSFLLFFVLPPNILCFCISFFFVLILFPSLYEATKDILSEVLKDDWEGVDMTKRYHRK